MAEEKKELTPGEMYRDLLANGYDQAEADAWLKTERDKHAEMARDLIDNNYPEAEVNEWLAQQFVGVDLPAGPAIAPKGPDPVPMIQAFRKNLVDKGIDPGPVGVPGYPGDLFEAPPATNVSPGVPGVGPSGVLGPAGVPTYDPRLAPKPTGRAPKQTLRVAQDWTEYFTAGLQGSATGLYTRDNVPNTVLPEDLGLFRSVLANVVAGSGTILGDAPVFFSAAIPAGFLGSLTPAGPAGGMVAAGVAGFAAVDASKSYMTERFKLGYGPGADDEVFLSTLMAATKGAGVGLVAEVAGLAVGAKWLGQTMNFAPGTSAIQKGAALMMARGAIKGADIPTTQFLKEQVAKVYSMLAVSKALHGQGLLGPNLKELIEGIGILGLAHGAQVVTRKAYNRVSERVVDIFAEKNVEVKAQFQEIAQNPVALQAAVSEDPSPAATARAMGIELQPAPAEEANIVSATEATAAEAPAAAPVPAAPTGPQLGSTRPADFAPAAPGAAEAPAPPADFNSRLLRVAEEMGSFFSDGSTPEEAAPAFDLPPEQVQAVWGVLNRLKLPQPAPVAPEVAIVSRRPTLTAPPPNSGQQLAVLAGVVEAGLDSGYSPKKIGRPIGLTADEVRAIHEVAKKAREPEVEAPPAPETPPETPPAPEVPAEAPPAAEAPPEAPPLKGPEPRVPGPDEPPMSDAEKIAYGFANNPGGLKGLERWTFTWDNIMQQFVDAYYPVEQLEKLLNFGEPLGAEDSPSGLMHLASAQWDQATQAIERSVRDPRTGQLLYDGLMVILKDHLKETDRWNAFAASKRALQLAKRGIKSGLDEAVAEQVVKEGSRFEASFERVQEFLKTYVDLMVREGLIDAKTGARILAGSLDYVPYDRVFDIEEQISGKKKAWQSPLRRRIEGSDRPIISPLESIIRNVFMYHRAIARNRARVALARLAEHPNIDPETIREIPTSTRVEVHDAEVRKMLEHFVIDTEPAGPESTNPLGFEIWRNFKFTEGDNEMMAMVNGKAKYYKLSDNLALAIKTVDGPEIDRFVAAIAKVASQPSRLLRAGATIGLRFSVFSEIRDFFVTIMTGKDGYVPGYDQIRGMIEAWNESEIFQEARAVGLGRTLSTEVKTSSPEEVVRVREATGLKTRVVNAVTAPWRWLRLLSELGELGPKVGQYIRSREAGKSPTEAVLTGRRITTDFSVQGANGYWRAYNSMVAFQNPAIQGTAQLLKHMAERPLDTMAGLWFGTMLPTLYIYLANHDNPIAARKTRQYRDMFFSLPIPRWEAEPKGQQEAESYGAGNYRQRADGVWEVNKGFTFEIPKGQGLLTLVSSLMERSLDAWSEKDPRAFKEFKDSMASQLSPIGVPNFAIPGISRWRNKNWLTDSQIVPDWMRDREHGISPDQHYTANTGELSKLLGKMIYRMPGAFQGSLAPIGLGPEPAHIENWVRTVTGGEGQRISKLLEIGLQTVGALPPDIKAKQPWYDNDFTRGFIWRGGKNYSQPVQDFEEEYNKLRIPMNTFLYALKSGKLETVEALKDSDELQTSQIAKQAAGYYESIKITREWVKAINAEPLSEEMTREKKAELIEGLYRNMGLTAENGLRMLDTVNEILERNKSK